MTSIERTSDHGGGSSPYLAWAQFAVAVICLTLAVIFGILGLEALACPVDRP